MVWMALLLLKGKQRLTVQCAGCAVGYPLTRGRISDTPSERRITERRITERRIIERRITERRITERRKLPNAELLNAERY
jgi:hypothetical protein